MSKSLGNFFTVRDLLDQGVPGEVIRFVMLSTHYRKPMDWTEKKRAEAEKTLQRWHDIVTDVVPSQAETSVMDALSSDLNTPLALTRLYGLADSIANDPINAAQKRSEFLASAQLLGLLTEDFNKQAFARGQAEFLVSISGPFGKIQHRLVMLREKAVLSKNFTEIDQAKLLLSEAGFDVRMTKEGISITHTPVSDFDALDGIYEAITSLSGND